MASAIKLCLHIIFNTPHTKHLIPFPLPETDMGGRRGKFPLQPNFPQKPLFSSTRDTASGAHRKPGVNNSLPRRFTSRTIHADTTFRLGKRKEDTWRSWVQFWIFSSRGMERRFKLWVYYEWNCCWTLRKHTLNLIYQKDLPFADTPLAKVKVSQRTVVYLLLADFTRR